MKELGNQHYKEKNYTEAISCYTQAISMQQASNFSFTLPKLNTDYLKQAQVITNDNIKNS